MQDSSQDMYKTEVLSMFHNSATHLAKVINDFKLRVNRLANTTENVEVPTSSVPKIKFS